ncbi:MAG TPA: isocitrate/isopropylmalate family dehydrogenase [Gemmatimonadales bacterium]|nr:isocitrate/isopropylmalate family dehydrogenase [Gemmatimonadales bacterium]
MTKRAATLITGDGIGPEITKVTLQALDALGVQFDWDEQYGGMAAVDKAGTPLPNATLDSIRRTKLCLKGPLTTPVGGGYRSVNVALRQEFDLYANVRPTKTMVPGGRYENVDLVIIRENTEGLYVGLDHTFKVGGDRRAMAQAMSIVTREGSERIARYAFEYAKTHGRKKVTIVHKANILKSTSGLFLEVARRVAEQYAPAILAEDKIVDNTAMQLVIKPEQFDVIVTTNLFGDILSDEAAGLVGGLGLAPGANIGTHAAIFEPVHGSAPDIAGKGIANPSAQLLAAAMMLDHLNELEAAKRLRVALETTIVQDQIRTADLGGRATTAEFGAAVVQRIRA